MDIRGGRNNTQERRMAHAVAFPYPAQGHIMPMMHLSKFLASNGFNITFVHTEFNLSRIITAHQYTFSDDDDEPNIHLVGVPEWFPPPSRHISHIQERVMASEQLVGPFTELMERLMNQTPRVSFIISDALLSWTQTVADQFHIPRVALWSSSLSCYAAYTQIPLLISKSYLPIPAKDSQAAFDKRDAKDPIVRIPGLQEKFRVSDMPSFFQVEDVSDYVLQFIIRQMDMMRQAAWVLANTFDELEGDFVQDADIGNESTFLTVGPLFAACTPLSVQSGSLPQSKIGASLWQEDDRCLEWLNKQAPASVLYVSFGSMAILSAKQVDEIALGLEASKQPFLWVFRPDLIDGESVALPDDFLLRTKDQGMVVSWAPQLSVLSHLSVGGFLTHCGWNSVLESIYMGVPMLGWPYFAEQKMNCRLLVDEWRIGMRFLAREDGCVGRWEFQRVVVELLVGEKGKEMRQNIGMLKQVAKRAMCSWSSGGCSSKHNLDKFLFNLQMNLKMEKE